MEERLAVIGTGKMGSALLRGAARSGLVTPARLTAFDADSRKLQKLAEEIGFRPALTAAEAAYKSDVIIIAVKPNVVPQVIGEISGAGGSRLVISIAAGVELATIEGTLPKKWRAIRAMPNIACSIGEGATAFTLGRSALPGDAKAAKAIFESVGLAVEVEEALLHAVTGLSGSGPGFICTVIEGLVRGAVKSGLPEKLAVELALQTVIGTGRTLQETGQTPEALRKAVATPGGTTMAGLSELERTDARGAFERAVEAAARRSRELAGGK